MNNQNKAKSELFKKLDGIFEKSPKSKEYTSIKDKWQCRTLFRFSEISEQKTTFMDDFGLDFLNLLVSPGIQDIRYYHYTNFYSLTSILLSGKIRLSCIVGINDSSEITFTDEMLGLRDPERNVNQSRIDYANDRFLLSLSRKPDDLNQWRLYGEDGKGVSLEFCARELSDEYKYPKGPFLFGNVIYDSSILKVLKESFRKIERSFGRKFTLDHIYLWRNFFKDGCYEPEAEFRIVFFNSKNKFTNEEIGWSVNRIGIFNSFVEFNIFGGHPMIFPFHIKRIIIGPKMSECKTNAMQLEYYRKNRGYGFAIETSKIRHYR